MADQYLNDPESSARTSLSTGGATVDGPRKTGQRPAWVLWIALGSAVMVLIANTRGIASGDDGVGYRAIADSIMAGDGLRYFLEDPLTIWPPLWPALMALVAKVTPLDTIGAAVVLNTITAMAAVLVGYRLLARTVTDQRLVLLGTLVIGLGGSTVGFGHLLMTDFAFAVVVMAWLLALMDFHDTGRSSWLVAAAALVWLGFGLRYVGIYLIALGGLWLLFDLRRRFTARLGSGVLYGVICVVVPIVWMLRNHGLDGTLTGERMPSARGPIDNGFDILGAMGRWLLPGVADGAKYMWAAIGGVVLLVAAWLGWRVLTAGKRRTAFDTPLRRFVSWLGRPTGLLAVQAFGYLTYMLYVRSTTALNQLELRLLNPAYFSLVALALVLIANLGRIEGPAGVRWHGRGMAVAHIWAVGNVAVGVWAMLTFAGGDPFFEGNYESDQFVEVRANTALEALPAGCEVYSNLPNGLYPELGPHWSPRRTGLESNQPVDDLAELQASVDERTTCLIWIDDSLVYGHLWSLEDLQESLVLVELDRSDDVTAFRIDPPTS